MQALRVSLLATLLGLAAFLGLACSDATGPTTGALRVDVTTTGADIDIDGYTVSVDGGPDQAITANGTITIAALSSGYHTVQLGGLGTNCQVSGANPRTLAVSAGFTATEAFSVTCVLRFGIRVTTVTTGSDIDPNGYLVRVVAQLQSVSRTIGANGDITISALQEGEHTVTLEDVATNCEISGSNARTVSVTLGATTEVAYSVTCIATTGSMRVTTATTGDNLDPDGYQVSVDAGTNFPRFVGVGINGAVTIQLAIGAHTVSLDGLAGNCAVSGDNPQTVTVAGGATNVDFAVVCAPPGSVRVTTTTTGSGLDPDGYLVTVDGDYYYPTPVGVNGTVTIPLPTGTHTVGLIGVAVNCAISGDNPLTVTVALGATTDVAFAVVCAPLGSVQVTAVTTGLDPDPNGYTVLVDGTSFYQTVNLATNGTVTIEPPAGSYVVTLGGVAANCVVTSPNALTVTVVSGGTVAVAFDVACAAVTQLAFVSTADGNEEIYIVNSNGTGAIRLTTDPARDVEPAWSPDGSKIAFRSHRDGNAEIYVMNANGSSPVRLTNHMAPDYQPTWSPDGAKIAFVSERDGNAEIYVINSDGTGAATRLTTQSALDVQPAWSPDGSKIAFRSDRDGNAEIYVMNAADGSGLSRLTNNQISDEHPTWSPDGTKLAFSRFAWCEYYYCGRNIFVMNPDGSGVTQLPSRSDDTDPTWSRDGSRIAFATVTCDYYNGCYYSAILAVRPNGMDRVEIISGPVTDPAWRP